MLSIGMTQSSSPDIDRRKRRTKAALFSAFRNLVTEDRKVKITVPDVITRANVGRSTFYEHFKNIEDLHLQSLSHPFGILVRAILTQDNTSDLEGLLVHFWENRKRARATFTGVERYKISRLLADMIEPHLTEDKINPNIPPRLIALQLADASLALIHGWVMAEAWCEPNELAEIISKTSQAILKTLAPDGLQST